MFVILGIKYKLLHPYNPLTGPLACLFCTILCHSAIRHINMCVTFGCFRRLLATRFPEAKQMQNYLRIHLYLFDVLFTCFICLNYQ